MDKVYWIRNQECTDIKTHGYVGVSQDPAQRFKSHLKKNQRIPKTGIWLEIVFEGTRDECFAKEEELRPIKNIGWNRAVGGAHGYKKGFAHSDETRAHLKSKWTEGRRKKAGQFRGEQNKKLIGQKRPKQSQAMAGKITQCLGKHTV